MNERLRKLRRELDLTQQEFADRLKVGRNNIAGYETNKRSPSDAVISLICREFNVNEEWLRNGTGEMFITQTRNEAVEFKTDLFKILTSLDEKDWQLLLKMAKTLVEQKGGEINE